MGQDNVFGSTYYDDEAFFESFQKRRGRTESPNNALERPALFSLLGSVEGNLVLDLGCGSGEFAEELLERGVEGYHGIDGSEKMVETARQKFEGKSAFFKQAHLECLFIPELTYDLIVSRFVFHYLKDVTALFGTVHQALTDNGRFVFSVQHPVLTSSIKSAGKGKRSDWIVDDYFRTGERYEPWINGKKVRKYHRSVEQYVTALLEAGFRVDGLKEGTPDRSCFNSDEEYERRLRIPLVLILSATKIS